MKRHDLKYDSRCKVCGGRLVVGTSAYMQKSPVTGKWEIFCATCIDGMTVMGKPAPSLAATGLYDDTPTNPSKTASTISMGRAPIEFGDDIITEIMGMATKRTSKGEEVLRELMGKAFGDDKEPDELDVAMKATFSEVEARERAYDKMQAERLAAEMKKEEPKKPTGPKVTLDYIKANAAWRMTA